MTRPVVEVMIPTLNEAEHIADAVASARRLGPVFVLDSGSTDGTQQLARDAGATVVEHAWEGFAAQKNWGIDHLSWQGEWVFILDADERVPATLADQVHAAVSSADGKVGYYVNRLMVFMGRPIRHGGLYPSWNLRLFRRGRARYEDRAVHEHMVSDAPTGYLREPMIHIRRETMSQYIAKHIRYADLEAEEWVRRRRGMAASAPAGRLFRRSLRLRQWLRREVWPALPGRPLWRFLYMYLLRFGFLDGRAGWRLAHLMASYELMISLLYREKLAALRTEPEPLANDHSVEA